MTTRARWSVTAAALLAASAVAAGCGGSAHKQTTFTSHGHQARVINDLVNPVFGVAGLVFVVILGGALFLSLKFKAKDDADFTSDEVSPRQVRGAAKLEITWTIVPAIILLAVGIFTVGTIFTLAKKTPKSSVHVEVIGQQWWWEYRYDLNGDGRYDDITTANDLVIPQGEQVQLVTTSRDVIHSFWIPALNGKKDAVPNHHSPLVFQADVTGKEEEYVGQCTEYCGLSHANMRNKAITLPRAQFDQWARNQQKKANKAQFANDNTSLASQGRQYFLGAKCAQCHVIDGENNKNFRFTDITAASFGEPGNATVPVQHQIKNGSTIANVVQESGAAPNLTHLMSRTSFAGALFDLRYNTPECRKLGVRWADTQANQDLCLNVPALKTWLRNPSGAKPMAPGGVPGRTGPRGMPNLNLTEQQIDQVVAYLKTLK